ncbi:MAG: cation transporter [Deltaproteobacteria bacterium]|nr:cation transporter [Candidatus Zymogenaceae bacterium]
MDETSIEKKLHFPAERHRDVVKRVTIIGMVVNVALTALKFAGGIIGGSQAVVADAVHSLSDMSTDVAILVGVGIWEKPADNSHPYGHRRVESMVTLGIGILLAAVAAGIFYNAVSTIMEPHAKGPEWIAFWAAIVSIVSKEVLYRWTAAAGKKIRSVALTANAWHHRTDALSSIPAALAVAGALIAPSWAVLDHIGAIVVSIFIFKASYDIARPAFDTLIDRGAPDDVIGEIERIAMETKGVESVHKIRTRYIGGESITADLHITVDEDLSVREGHDISEEVKRRLIELAPDVIDVVVHLEPHGEP